MRLSLDVNFTPPTPFNFFLFDSHSLLPESTLLGWKKKMDGTLVTNDISGDDRRLTATVSVYIQVIKVNAMLGLRRHFLPGHIERDFRGECISVVYSGGNHTLGSGRHSLHNHFLQLCGRNIAGGWFVFFFFFNYSRFRNDAMGKEIADPCSRFCL